MLFFSQVWLKKGIPSLICIACIERLRVAYEFRNICLQSDKTLQQHINQLQENEKNVSEVEVERHTLSNCQSIKDETEEEYSHLRQIFERNDKITKADTCMTITVTEDSDEIVKTETFFVDSLSTAVNSPETGKVY